MSIINDPMSYNFELLKERIFDTLNFNYNYKTMSKIKNSVLCVGSGGSKVVADYASTVFVHKNSCCSKALEPRDVLYENIKTYKNLFVCSYSGNNHGVNILKDLKTKKYLMTYGDITSNEYKLFKCNSTLAKEKSFISLASTLMPMSILLKYYLKDKTESFIEEVFSNIPDFNINIKNVDLPFDVISGNDTSTAEIYLDSTFTESGLGSINCHRKYDYCHGRSTLRHKQRRNLIYIVNTPKELDKLLLSELKVRYEDIIVLKSNYNNIILDNYYLTLQAMYFTKYLAELKNIDLSIVEYDKELCKLLYKFKGEM